MRVVEVFPEVVDTALISQLENNKLEINFGRTNILSLLNRFSPGLALKIINKAGTMDNRIDAR